MHHNRSNKFKVKNRSKFTDLVRYAGFDIVGNFFSTKLQESIIGVGVGVGWGGGGVIGRVLLLFAGQCCLPAKCIIF